jgi:hypothetical protein
MTDYVDKNPRAIACLILPSLWGRAAQVGFSISFQSQMRKVPPTSELEPALTPVTSHLEGVGNDLAACAAITLVHCTPPPFIAFIVPCNLETVKLFLKIRWPGCG